MVKDELRSKKKRIAIIAALQSEIEILKNELIGIRTDNLAGSEVYTGTIGGCDIVLMQCGMGKVSAAAGTQAIIIKYVPDCVINTGCAGALSGDLRIGDIVIADRTVEWDLDLISLGLPRGFVSALDAVYMNADNELASEIERNISEKETVVRGLIVSGDQFVDRGEQRSTITEAFPDALCAEMEGAAVGHVCRQNDVPFCIIRTMSDTADGNSNVNFAEFSEQAGKKSAGIIINMLKNI